MYRFRQTLEKCAVTSVPFLLLSAALLTALFVSLTHGAIDIPLSVLWHSDTPRAQGLQHILLYIRFPRSFAALLVGSALAVSGAVMQGLFRNPLVDPGVVGVMGGASLFVALTIVLLPVSIQHMLPFDSAYFLPVSAFVGSWCSMMLLYYLSRRNGQVHIAVMLLLGIALAAFSGAITGLLSYMADNLQMRALMFWGMGSLATFDWTKLMILAVVLIIAFPLLISEARVLNAMMLGEHVVSHLGFNIARSKSHLIILVALLAGVCVAFAGGIAFVGLVVPHMMRSILGAEHRRLLFGSALCGALLLLLADMFARTVVAPAELPIGIVTSILGAPFLAWLVWQRTTRGGL